MAEYRRGRQSFVLPHSPVIAAWASVAGKKESEGPLAGYYDEVSPDNRFGEKTWEQAEQTMQQKALSRLMRKAGICRQDVQLVCSGDLLNQCIGSSFTLRNQHIPHLGLYGACSTMAESLMLAAAAVGGGFCDRAVAMTSSHFAASERQYRFPLAYGGQRTPAAQWTVTGAGAALLQKNGAGPKIEACTVGSVVDLGITDPSNMGAAMAPAAYDTIRTHLDDLHLAPEDYDLIVTGDLGSIGTQALLALAEKDGIKLENRLTDCGNLVFDIQRQKAGAGGSGCGCSAIALCSYVLARLEAGKLRKILFCGTGALLSPLSTQQGLAIPGICHGVAIGSGRC